MQRVCGGLALVLALLMVASIPASGQTAITFTRVIPDIELLGPPSVEIERGGNADVRLAIRSHANETERLQLRVDQMAPHPETGADVGARISPSMIELGPGETLNLTLSIHAFQDSVAKNATLIVEAIGIGSLVVTRGSLVAEFTEPPEATLPTAAFAGVAALAGAGALFALLRRIEWLRYAAIVALLPFYTRLASSRVLDQERRQSLFKLIEGRPGLSFSELLRKSALSSGVLVHHLRTLERHKLVVSRRDGVKRVFAITPAAFPPPAPPPVTPAQEEVLRLLREEPRTQRSLAEALGVSQQGANRHVKALERRGLLEIRYEAGEWRCHAIGPSSAGSPRERPTTDPFQS